MRSVLITGGSEGIGLELARLFVQDNTRVILVARNEERLAEVKRQLESCGRGEVLVFSADLIVPEERQALYKAVKDLDIDVLVNNAGIGFAGPVWHTGIEDDLRLIRLNDEAVVHLCKLFVSDMIARREGMIINMASTGAFQPGPYIASYYASKAFVVNYTEALAYETRSYGLKVHAYCPGPVDTAFYPKSKGVKPPFAVTPVKAAEYLYTHLNDRRVVLVPGVVNKIMRIMPKWIKVPVLAEMKRSNGGWKK